MKVQIVEILSDCDISFTKKHLRTNPNISVIYPMIILVIGITCREKNVDSKT